jgi:putative Mg2+ transporter-C (MgtC) family protein
MQETIPLFARRMQFLTLEALQQYWTGSFFAANLIICLNLVGALLLGMLVGYERAYHGRAAGMRTYGLVCMASTALTVFVGYSDFWFGGSTTIAIPDATRVVQGIVTGVGFLCGGVIMKDGLSISGLTTAASLWAASAIGVLMGVGFYGAAMMLALLCTLSMSLMHKLERWLPARSMLQVTLTFKPGFVPQEDVLIRVAAERGYRLLLDSLAISATDGKAVWNFATVAGDKTRAASPAQLAQELTQFEGVVSFNLTPLRN